jgi:hypothetical protein
MKDSVANFFARFAGSSLAEEFGRWEKFPDKHLKRSEKVVFQLHAWLKVQKPSC